MHCSFELRRRMAGTFRRDLSCAARFRLDIDHPSWCRRQDITSEFRGNLLHRNLVEPRDVARLCLGKLDKTRKLEPIWAEAVFLGLSWRSRTTHTHRHGTGRSEKQCDSTSELRSSVVGRGSDVRSSVEPWPPAGPQARLVGPPRRRREPASKPSPHGCGARCCGRGPPGSTSISVAIQ